MNLLSILLQAAPMAPGQEPNNGMFWVMMALIFVVMWFFMIRPQRKKQKEIEEQRSQLKPGSKVVTAGGIHGKIEKVQETTFEIEIAKGIIIKVDKTSVFMDVIEPKKEEKKD